MSPHIRPRKTESTPSQDDRTLLPRDDALPFPHVLRVEASAGSGKTYLLACRFVQFLLSDRIPHSRLNHILALTFTNEATAEMRRRILGFLKQLAFADPVAMDAIRPFLAMDTERLQGRAAAQVDELLASFDQWQVRTIDSFVHRLVQSAPAELGLSPRQEIAPHEAPYHAAALDRILWRLNEAPGLRSLLHEFVLHHLHAQGRGAWWPQSALLSMLRELYTIEAVHGLSFREGPEASSLRLARELGQAATAFLERAQAEGLALKKPLLAAIEAVAHGDLPKALGRKAWGGAGLSDLCRKGTSPPEALKGAWEALRALAGRYAVARAEAMALPYVRLLAPWRRELTGLKERDQVLFLSDLNRFARRLLDDMVLSEVAFRLGERLYHYLIDEFQDTSALQWANLFPLIENALAQGGSLFCVGDQKQLLYRWRGSDLAVFQRGQEGFGAVPGCIELVLPFSWRSREVVVETVGRVFSEENIRSWINSELDLPDETLFIDIFRNVKQAIPSTRLGEASQGGLVSVRILPDGELAAVEEAGRLEVIRLLQEEILPRRSPHEVLVLVRDNREVQRVTGWLAGAGIAAVSHRQMDIRQDPIVRGLLKVLGFLARPTDDLALASVLSGEIASEAWARFVAGQGGPDVWQWLESCRVRASRGGGEDRRGYLYQRLRGAYPAFWEAILAEPLSAVGFMPTYDLLVLVIRRLALEGAFPAHEAAFQHLLELVHTQEAGGGAYGLEAFLRWVEEGPEDAFMAEPPVDLGAVRVMTVHKAKGLEAEVVVLPRLAVAARSPSRLYRTEGGAITILQTTKELRQVSPDLARWHKDELDRQWVDEMNVLYVALTRAREELYLVVPPRVGKARNRLLALLSPLLPEGRGGTWGERPRSETARRLSSRTGEIPPLGTVGQGAALSNGGMSWPGLLVRRQQDLRHAVSPSRRLALREGEEAHRVLALLPVSLPVEPKPETVSVFLEGLFGGRPHTSGLDLAVLAKTLCDPAARPLFWPETGASAWAERDVADASGNLYRLDRLVVAQGGLWVGEYKTGAGPRDEDAAQIRHYLDLMAGVYPGLKKAGLVLYVDCGLVTRVVWG